MIVAAMSRTKYSAFQPVLLPLPLLFLVTKLELLPRHDEVRGESTRAHSYM